MGFVKRNGALLLAVALVGAVALDWAPLPRLLPLAAAVDPVNLEVTSTADTPASPVCPDATLCTLRRAIEVANADATGAPIRISFGGAAYPAGSPGSIVLGAVPLPVVTRNDVTIDGAGRGVRLSGTRQSLTPSVNAIVTTGTNVTVRGVEIRGFAGVCLLMSGAVSTAGGDPAAGQGNVIDDCETGIRLDGDNAHAQGNRVGLLPGTAGGTNITVGIWVTGRNAVVGESASGEGHTNEVGNASTAIRVGGTSVPLPTGVRVGANILGGNHAAPAPVQAGVEVMAAAAGIIVAENRIGNAATGIRVHGSSDGPSATKVTLSGNVFANIVALAIDLNADGIRNANDEGDRDAGANSLLNTPVLGRAVQSRVTGTACAGCQVQLYVAAHRPGGHSDYGSNPVPGGPVVADAFGSFAIDNPSVAPGEWLVALATDGDGNTSEFSRSTRVGAGAVQCGSPALVAGWNLVGYFGAQSISLGNSFPAEGAGSDSVRAIYHLDSATGIYAHWLAGPAGGRSLDSLQPGEAYWILSTGAVSLPGGFSLSVPVPAALHAGWNTLLYIGASAAVEDSLISVDGKYTELYAWASNTQRWERYGGPGAPAWTREFTSLEACHVYQVFMTEDAVLTPLQP